MRGLHGWDPGPYADEKPLYVVTKDNMGEHAQYLTEGQKALLTAYPDDFRIPVYPSHRDFSPEDWVCDVVRYNAKHARLLDDGLRISGQVGSHPFPFASNGMEAIWNVMVPHRASSESVTYDIANVFAHGKIAWGKAEFRTWQESFDGLFERRVAAYLQAQTSVRR